MFSVILNKSFKKRIDKVKPVAQTSQMAHLYLSIGLLMFNKTIKPMMANKMVDAEEISLKLASNMVPKITIAATMMVPTKPQGNDLNKMFFKKVPLMISLFGTWDKKKAGIPIVNILIKEI